MKKTCVIILFLAITAILAVSTQPCVAKDKGEESIWTEGEGRGPDRGSRRGGPGGRGRFELTDEEVNRILKELKERSPEKARELEKLREKDPEKFNDELRRHAREEFGKIVKERIDKWRQQRQADFLEWLGKNVPDEAENLAKLKERSPDLYDKMYELASNKYRRAFEESRRNPELGNVLIEDIRLQKRRDHIIGKIHASKSKREKEKLTEELEEVIGHRYDLIVRRKQIAYERLLGWLEDLQNKIKESRAEIAEARNAKVKEENIKNRTKELLEEKKKGFPWD